MPFQKGDIIATLRKNTPKIAIMRAKSKTTKRLNKCVFKDKNMQIFLQNELDSKASTHTKIVQNKDKISDKIDKNDKIRLDEYLTKALNTSKSQVLNLIKKGLVSLNNKPCKKGGILLKENDKIHIKKQDSTLDCTTTDFSTIDSIDESAKSTDFTLSNATNSSAAKPRPKSSQHQNIHIERIYENSDFMILSKTPFLCVHSAPSLKEPTLVDWLKANNIMLSNLAGEQRAGIVHRLDKQTSGAIIIAKNNSSHAILSNELKAKNIGRYYLALIDSPLKERVIIESKIARHPKNRLKMANIDSFHNAPQNLLQSARYAKSEFAQLLSNQTNGITLIAAKLYTGRTHQIRTHLEKLNRHIIYDTTYGFSLESMKKESKALLLEHSKTFTPRVFLHAYLLYMPANLIDSSTTDSVDFANAKDLAHTQKYHAFCASVFDDMLQFCLKIFGKRQFDEAIKIPNILGLFDDEDTTTYHKSTT